MPLYEYRCLSCEDVTEVLQERSDRPKRKCAACGGRLEKLISRTGFVLKGSGWYVHEYGHRKDSPSGDEAPPAAAKTGESKGGAQGGESKGGAQGGESKGGAQGGESKGGAQGGESKGGAQGGESKGGTQGGESKGGSEPVAGKKRRKAGS